MLAGTGQLVEQRGFAAVLVTDQRKCEHGSFRQGIAAALGMELALFTKARMLGFFPLRFRGTGFILLFQQGDRNLFGVRQAKRQLIFMNPQLERITHRGILDQGDLRTGDNAHIQEMLAQRAFSADNINPGRLAGFQFIQVHQYASSLIRSMSISDKYDTTNLSGCNGKKR